MLLKRLLLGMTLSPALFSFADTSDPASLLSLDIETRAVPCEKCPIPGKECRSYIATSTDKICLSSDDGSKKNDDARTGDVIMAPQSDDSTRLEESLEYTEDVVSEPFEEAEDDMTVEENPL